MYRIVTLTFAGPQSKRRGSCDALSLDVADRDPYCAGVLLNRQTSDITPTTFASSPTNPKVMVNTNVIPGVDYNSNPS